MHEVLPGRTPSVIFGEDEHGCHGNFHPASYRAILGEPAWHARLAKPHTANRRARPRSDWRWRELDAAASSDALLMNIFCYPGVLRSDLSALLGLNGASRPRFGLQPRLQRERGLIDTTEIDMELGGLLVESKLTEASFQVARPSLLARYCDWVELFDEELLPRTEAGAYRSYQLLRGVMAAEITGRSFCLFCDERRHDLIDEWHSVVRSVRSAALRCRLKLLTWQANFSGREVRLRSCAGQMLSSLAQTAANQLPCSHAVCGELALVLSTEARIPTEADL